MEIKCRLPKVILVAESEREHKVATWVLEWGPWLTVILAFAGLVNYLCSGPFSEIVIVTFFASITGIAKAVHVEPPAATAATTVPVPAVTGEKSDTNSENGSG
ncbi:hypothetical protein [Natrinema saccharevitans]|uniref:hypothetical protein n=1 Tax=Natrinema saccharevitans TaxID=301967 RepID=UPI00111568F0|nr:hypothetical protein [Natrinema saccharevitans]